MSKTQRTMTTTKPREWWVNIYPTFAHNVLRGHMYASKQEADNANALAIKLENCDYRVACVRVREVLEEGK